MKQYITIEQRNKLSKKGLDKYWDFLNRFNERKDIPYSNSELLSISQMIEFLGGVVTRSEDENKLCNILWQATKDKLEK